MREHAASMHELQKGDYIVLPDPTIKDKLHLAFIYGAYKQGDRWKYSIQYLQGGTYTGINMLFSNNMMGAWKATSIDKYLYF